MNRAIERLPSTLRATPLWNVTGVATAMIAVLLSLTAAAFWLGHRMQRDTEGLV